MRSIWVTFSPRRCTFLSGADTNYTATGDWDDVSFPDINTDTYFILKCGLKYSTMTET